MMISLSVVFQSSVGNVTPSSSSDPITQFPVDLDDEVVLSAVASALVRVPLSASTQLPR